ncbi:MAG: glycosyltransferase [Neisseria sp.]|nr:glycosyltransferase [Neisseria sp.]
MHVLLLPSWYPAHAADLNGSFFRQQALALQAQGVKIGVIAPLFRSLRGETRSLWHGKYGETFELDHGIPTYRRHSMLFFPKLPYIDRGRWLNAGKKLFARYLAEHGKPDVLHAHCVNFGGILAAQISQQHGIPYVITEHSSTYARGLIAPWQRAAMQTASENAAARFAVSQAFCKLLNEQIPNTKWQYLPNMLGADFAADFIHEPLPSEPFRFCAVAHLHRHKGIDIVLNAFAQVHQDNPNIQLDIIGDGGERATLEQQAQQLNIAAKVHFHGKGDSHAVRQLMRQSHAFLLASRVETFGIVLIEALSQGLPVIATNNLGPQSIVHPEHGLLVANDNPSEFAHAMQMLMHNYSQFSPEQLRADCLNEFSETAIAQQLINHYRHALAR